MKNVKFLSKKSKKIEIIKNDSIKNSENELKELSLQDLINGVEVNFFSIFI